MKQEGVHICKDERWPMNAVAATGCHMLVADVSGLMEDADLQERALMCLSPARRLKTETITHPRGRALSIGVGLLLDELLGEVGLCERDMSYVEGEHGKPSFADHPELLFNLSHSGSMAAAIVAYPPSGFSGVGVDVQRITRYRPELVRRVFSPADRRQLSMATDDSTRERLFAQLWSRAEAYAKATGRGLEWPFTDPPAEAGFHDFMVKETYCGSVCFLR